MSATKELRVLSVKFRNVLGLEERGLDPQGRSVLLSGPNASGKSSHLRALKAGISGGSLATLKRVDAPADAEPEVVVELGGTAGDYLVEKQGDDTARVRRRVGESAAFEDVPQPQRFLTSLFDTRGCNPVALLMAKEKDLALLILEALDLKLDAPRLSVILEGVKEHVLTVPAGLHALEHTRLIRDGLYNARTGVNRDKDSKRKAAEQTKLNAPAVVPTEPGQDAIVLQEKACSDLAATIAREDAEADGRMREAIAEASASCTLEQERQSSEFKAAAAKLRKEHEQRVAESLAQTNNAVEALRVAAEGRIVAATDAADMAEAKAREAREAVGVVTDGRRAELGKKREALAALRAQAQDAAKAIALHEQARQFEQEAEAHAAESERLTEALQALDVYRRSLAEHLPIAGLEIAGEAITCDGVPWDQLNTEKRVTIVATIAAIRAEANPLRVMFLDGLESLDTKHRTALLEELERRRIQAFGAVVTDGPLAVEYIGAVHADPEAVGAAPVKVTPIAKGRSRAAVLSE